MLYKIITRQHGATLTYVDLTDRAALVKAAILRSQGIAILIVGQGDGKVVQEAELVRWIKDGDGDA